nr:retrovirus-related Pol polyprotein from transposon TNT 1-94 [Tanacetum cinerariifolium]
MGYSTQSRAYRVFNKRTRVIKESIHVNFDELPHMASDQISFDPAPECQSMALEHNSLSPTIQCQANVPQADRTVTTSNEMDLLFSPMFDELLNGSSKVMSKSSVVSAADAPNQRQNHTTPFNNHTTHAPTCQVLTLPPTVSSSENINQAEMYAENDQERGDECILVGYSNQSRAYRVFNKRTRVIMETIHVNFDELPQVASDQISSDPAPECQRMALEHDSLSPTIQRQANVPQEDRTVTMSNELDLLFSPMFDELLNGSSKVVSKSSAVCSADAPIQHMYAENDQVANDEFINIFCTSVQDQGETSSRHVDSSNMHTFYQLPQKFHK